MGAFWKAVDQDDLRRFLGEAAEKMGVAWLKARSVDFTERLFKQFRDTAYMPAPIADPNRVLINLQNGTFEIGTDAQQLRTPDAADFLTHQLPLCLRPRSHRPTVSGILRRGATGFRLPEIISRIPGLCVHSSGKTQIGKGHAFVWFGG